MIYLMRYLKRNAHLVVIIIALLFLQAYCDLALPGYTSRIINIGIQQHGIEDGVPETIRTSSMEDLMVFMREEQASEVLSFYEQDGDSFILRSHISADERTELERLLQKPMLFVTGVKNGGEGSLLMSEMTAAEESVPEEASDVPEEASDVPEEATSGSEEMSGVPEEASSAPKEVSAGGPAEDSWMNGAQMNISMDALKKMPKAVLLPMLEKMDGMLDKMPESIISQAAVSYVYQEYQEAGMDVDALQLKFILTAGLKMILMALLVMAAAVLVTFFSSRVAAGLGHDLRSSVYQKVIGFSSREYHKFSTASLITRCTNDVQQVQFMMVMMFRIVLYAPIIGIGGLIRVLRTDSSMTWILGLAILLILVVIGMLFLIAMPRFVKLQSLIDRLNLVTREILNGIPVIRAFSREKHEEDRFEDANITLTRTNLFVNRCMTFMMPVMMLIMNGVTVLIMYNGALGVEKGTMQVGNMMAFIQYAMQVIMAFLMITAMSIMLPRANVAAGRIRDVLQSTASILDPEIPVRPTADQKGYVEFDHVSFAYPEAGENVLTDISFTAGPGETVAVIGSTGSGKSTLVNLIPRFYDVTEGVVRVDGVDVRCMAQKDLRGRIGYVPQKGVLFSGTIASNICYADENISEDRMKAAAEVAQASDFIEEKPSGYASPIAQGGSNVSGGQKQRLSIARAVVKEPEIYIFDDSFSALDFKTDKNLRQALKEYTRDAAVIIVAQRISTILQADRILVLDEGHLAGCGTHRQLMESCEVYRQIAMSQLSEEELA